MKVFGHTWKDGILVALAIAQIALVVEATLNAPTLPLGSAVALGAAIVFVICTNFQCVAHNVAAMAENYLEHHGAVPGARKTDSVSAYGWLYNLSWFNNGYHQEHHWKPQVHWTEIPRLRSQLPPETSRRVVRAAHWFDFFPPPRTT